MPKPIAIRPYMGARRSAPGMNQSAVALRDDFNRQVRGLTKVFEQWINGLDEAMGEVVVEAIRPTFEKALSYTPVDTAALVESGYLELETLYRRKVVAIGFARGNKPDYAIYVHEMPYSHQAPTRSKFLEAAIDEDWRTLQDRFARLTKEAAGT